MQGTRVERVRGANDVLPPEYATLKQLERALGSHFESFGYRPMDVPIVEHTDLYLKKAGDEVIARLYDFTYQNRRLSLRPEMTASTIRAYVDSLQQEPLPVRLYVHGPVFRYEKPQRGRSRQFTQMGVELIGGAGALADAEVISLACKGLNQLGLTEYRVVIGHVGILAEFLEHLDLDPRLSSFLVSNMEVLGREGVEHVMARLHELFPSLRQRADEAGTGRLTDLFGSMDDGEAQEAILDLLRSMNVELGGTRAPEEIVTRLLTKMRRQDQTSQIEQALDFMARLGQLVGDPFTVLDEADALVAAHGMSRLPLEQLRADLETLRCYQLDWSRIHLDFGLSRGLRYYTGMIFEIHHGAAGEERQICGGGRYDDLVAVLGGQADVPAVGFAYGLERLRLALESEGRLSEANSARTDVLVIPVSAEEYGYAVGVAEQLRAEGARVELDVRGRSVKNNLQYAGKQGIPFTIIVGSEEARAAEVVLRNMVSREERRAAIGEAIEAIKRARAGV
jgi:histidyl-tRNA synthetase